MTQSPTPVELLRDAVARNLGAMLQIPADATGEPYKSRFLGDTPEGFWVEVPPRMAATLEVLRKADRQVGITFRAGERNATLTANVLKYESSFRVSATLRVEAVMLGWPPEVALKQRRSGYRVKLPMDCGLSAIATVIDADAPASPPPPAASTQTTATTPVVKEEPGIAAEVRDLSVTGVGLILRANRTYAPRVKAGQRLRVKLTKDQVSVYVAGPIKFEVHPLPDGSQRLGVDLSNPGKSMDDRRAMMQLNQWVAEFQRAEVRRRKVG